MKRDLPVGDKRIIAICAAMLVATVLGWIACGVAVVVLTNRVGDSGRADSYRLCDRGNVTRAEIHLAYQNLVPSTVRAENLARVRRTLPIFDCSPILNGEPAFGLVVDDQRVYVEQYAAGNVPAPSPPRPGGQ